MLKWVPGLKYAKNNYSGNSSFVKFKNWRLTPNMTSDTAPYGIARANGVPNTTYNQAYRAFWQSNGSSYGYGHANSSNSGWVEYEFPTFFKKIHVKSIELRSQIGNDPTLSYNTGGWYSNFKIQAKINGELVDVTGELTATHEQWINGFTVPLDVKDCTVIRFQGIKKGDSNYATLYNCRIYGDMEIEKEYLFNKLL